MYKQFGEWGKTHFVVDSYFFLKEKNGIEEEVTYAIGTPHIHISIATNGDWNNSICLFLSLFVWQVRFTLYLPSKRRKS
jgi:hypothetical protein